MCRDQVYQPPADVSGRTRLLSSLTAPSYSSCSPSSPNYTVWSDPPHHEDGIQEGSKRFRRGGAAGSLFSPCVSRGSWTQEAVYQANEGTGRQLWSQLKVRDPWSL